MTNTDTIIKGSKRIAEIFKTDKFAVNNSNQKATAWETCKKNHKTLSTAKNVKQDDIVLNEDTKLCYVDYSYSGDISIFPCSEHKQDVTRGVYTVAQQGKMLTDSDGLSYFRPYRQNTGERYRYLLRTRCGDVKEGKRSYIYTIRLPKHLDSNTLCELFNAEAQCMSLFTKRI